MKKLPVKIPFSGFYETSHDAIFDNWLEYEIEHLESEKKASKEDIEAFQEAYYSDVNWKIVHKEYAKAYCVELAELVANASRKYKEDSTGKRYLSEPLTLSLEFIEMTSPREYNFATDCIYCNIPLEQLQYMLNEIPADDWREFVKSKCTSYSGFISFYPSNYDDWEKDLTQWGEARLGMILEAYIVYILTDEIPDNINDALCAYNIMERKIGNGFVCDLIFSNAGEKLKGLDARLNA